MGTDLLASAQQSLLSYSGFDALSSQGAQDTGGPRIPTSLQRNDPTLLSRGSRSADCLACTGGEGLEETFQAMVYSSQMQRVSLAAEMQEISARTTSGDGTEAVDLTAKQLTFDFFAESRTDELMVFQQRTGQVADQLEGAKRATYIEASRQVATRFSMSVEVSSAVLSGFSNASQGLPETSQASFDDFNTFIGEALEEVDDVLNQVFALLDDFFSGEGDFETRFNEFIEGLNQIDLSGFTSLMGGQGPEGAEQAAYGVQLEFNFSFEFEMSQTVSYGGEIVQESDPIVLDLDGDGYELTSYKNGARFDIEGSGRQVRTAFVTGGDAFLAIDRDGNGSIDSGRELFGDQNGAANGFEELRKLDSNHDGVINSRDDRFSELLLFKDNGNGVTEEGELISLADAGIDELDVGYRNVFQGVSGGNRIEQAAKFRYADGRQGRAADAVLNFTV